MRGPFRGAGRRGSHARTRSRGWQLTSAAVVTILAFAVVLPLGLVATKAAPASADSAPAASPASGAGPAYLGAFVDPTGAGLTKADPTGANAQKGVLAGLSAEIPQLGPFNSHLGRPLSLVSVYQAWTDSVLTTQLDQISAAGAIPVITWECSRKGGTTADITSGRADGTIKAFADSLASAGVHVIVRWFPDPNAPDAATSQCLGQGTAAQQATRYAAAWQDIHSIFAQKAPNVAFEWSVDTSTGTAQSWNSFYPGKDFVDWIGADDAYRSTASTPSSEFAAWYGEFSSSNKPMMIHTAAPGAAQSSYLTLLASALPAQFPLVHGLMYFDAPDLASGAQYQLSAAGLQKFRALSGMPEFQPTRSPATIKVDASAATDYVGQVVKITATVSGTDSGGTIAFMADGNVIPGCQAVPVRLASSCDTSSLPQGSHQLTAAYSGDALYGTAASDVSTVSINPLTVPVSGLPPIPGVGQSYLGGFIKPKPLSSYPPGSTPTEAELTELSGFDASLSRPLSIVHAYQKWGSAIPGSQLRQILASGAIPMIDWKCGTDLNQLINGADDVYLESVAADLASVKSPVFLRWFYEPNFPTSNEDTTCFGNAANGPLLYQKAWRYIHDLFLNTHHHPGWVVAANVAWVWCIGTTGRDQDLVSYYPGNAYVDWIGADGYERVAYPPSYFKTHNYFVDHFSSWYNDFSSFGKPMLVGETGAIASTQAPYLQEISSALKDQFTQIRAVNYFDDPAHWNYVLSPGSGTGFSAFQHLDASGLFQPARQPSPAATVKSTIAAPLAGQQDQLTVTLPVTDYGGSFSLYANGSTTPLRGCAQIPVSTQLTCYTDAIPAGASNVVARYSGDAAFAPTASPPLSLQIGNQPVSVRVHAPIVPGPNQAYLGAWIDPSNAGDAGLGELKDLPSFNAGLGRPLSIVHLYQGWTHLAPIYEVRKALSYGAIPMIDWQCGDSDKNVIAGLDDPAIFAYAQHLAALKAPIFLRWYYEPNFTQDGYYNTCIAQGGPLGYEQAFQHIHDVFREAGATNVAFVWSLTVSGSQENLSSYYPGSAYVDWIAADGFTDSATPGPNAVNQLFGSWYNEFSSYGKPMMISETGALGGAQQPYLEQLAAALPSRLPQIKAVLYFDAPGGQALQKVYTLGSTGLGEVQSLSRSAYFLPTRAATSTNVTVSPAAVVAGRPVTLTATAPASDNGGSVSYFADGSPVAGCQSVALAGGSQCVTKSLPTGYSAITATYTGDANFTGSAAPPALVSVYDAPGRVGSGGAGATAVGLTAGAGGLAQAGSYPAFSGLPTIHSVSPEHLPAPGNHDPVVFQQPLADSSHYGNGGLASLIPAAGIPGGAYGTIAVLIGLGLVLLFGSYMVTTWLIDRRRQRLAAKS